ncbi:MAG: aspartate dehydrogenase [Lachnospiraceae bacterium]|nr:aspartate dehydrogenase [Lachnospiraceae bacterium]
MFQRKKKSCGYDKETQKPVMRVSICTGEKVAGFQDRSTGKFTDVMLIRSEKDLSEFCKEYRVEKEDIEKVW